MQSYRDIIHEYSPMLYWHIRRMVVVHEDAEDVLQETFVQAYRKLWMLRNPKALKTWLYRIATNEANRLLARKRPHADLSAELENSLSSQDLVDVSVEAEIRLQKALLTMSDMQRTVFCLKYYDDLTYEEIASVCKSSVASVKVIYHNAKEKVKQNLVI